MEKRNARIGWSVEKKPMLYPSIDLDGYNNSIEYIDPLKYAISSTFFSLASWHLFYQIPLPTAPWSRLRLQLPLSQRSEHHRDQLLQIEQLQVYYWLLIRHWARASWRRLRRIPSGGSLPERSWLRIPAWRGKGETLSELQDIDSWELPGATFADFSAFNFIFGMIA